MKTVSLPDNDSSDVFRALNVTRVELVFLQSLYRHGEGKNALKFAYLRKAVLFLEPQIELLKFTFHQAIQFPADPPPPDTSQVCFVPQSGGLGIDSMGEFALSFELSRQFLDAQGRPAPLILISQALERAFHFSFGNIYKSKALIFKRKPYNLTKALDSLRNLLVRENRDRKMKKDDPA